RRLAVRVLVLGGRACERRGQIRLLLHPHRHFNRPFVVAPRTRRTPATWRSTTGASQCGSALASTRVHRSSSPATTTLPTPCRTAWWAAIQRRPCSPPKQARRCGSVLSVREA